MSRTRCPNCGAPRKPLDRACLYCGGAYEDRGIETEPWYVEASGDPNVLYETRAAKRWLLWSHPSCRLRLTRDQLIFEDPEDKAYPFTLSMDELRSARFESPRGFFSTDDDLLIILEDGPEYEIGLDEGVKAEVLKMLKAILARYD